MDLVAANLCLLLLCCHSWLEPPRRRQTRGTHATVSPQHLTAPPHLENFQKPVQGPRFTIS